jgi:putative transposase
LRAEERSYWQLLTIVHFRFEIKNIHCFTQIDYTVTRKFKNKYRIDTVRAKWWDYTNNGSYFVTICTKDRQHFFRNIVETPKLGVPAQMELNEIGKLTQKFWMEIPQHFPFVILDEFVVMPNHVHGIICVSKSVDAPNLGASTDAKKNWSPGSLGVIINQYKRICTIHARKINPQFAWQPRFYDIIIKNEKSFHNIRRYIKMNPAKWHRDRNKQKDLFF